VKGTLRAPTLRLRALLIALQVVLPYLVDTTLGKIIARLRAQGLWRVRVFNFLDG
jgi:hypothetical protein